ncbi:hypothetical protein BLX24_08225 [Arsenicibacter rosenii]|uniref:Heavy metal-binding domain-containing protein n=2 Tax=Arsenicibacter rosenii TaxID=1750698 RepID=A0A1S2VNP8_9BACT|nr:hypothetical protein BLX24_08225 [Arsenicibacter rosenii]
MFATSPTTAKQTATINKYTNADKEGYCIVCAQDIYAQIGRSLTQQKNELDTRLRQILHKFPILTSPAPVNWDYEVLGMITTQTTSGTGFLTELSRGWNDLFGTTSNASNQKIAAATSVCMTELRIKAARAGANAIVSADIDFSEVGSGSTNMLMVCMAGTAIRVKSLEYFPEVNRPLIIESVEIIKKLDELAEEDLLK